MTDQADEKAIEFALDIRTLIYRFINMSGKRSTISPGAILEAAEVLKCIGHPTRLEILELLDKRGEQNVTAIQEAIGLDQPITSQHLGLMRDKGIVASRREGANVYYRVQDEKVTRVLDCIRACDV